MSDDDTPKDGFDAGLRWIKQQVQRSVEHLEELDIDQVAHAAGVDADRVKELLDRTGQWINDQADGLVGGAADRFGGSSAPGDAQAPLFASVPGAGPHPLDLPTAAQGLALSAIDSGRWTVRPGSDAVVARDRGPAPADASGLVGELRARDWINANGEVTLVGRNALKRWMEHAEAG